MRRATQHTPDLRVAAGDDAGARGRLQRASGVWAGLQVDPGGRSLLPARLHRGRAPGARSPSRLPAASTTAPSLETKLPTLNQSLSATLPPPHPTRRAAPRRAVLEPSSALALPSPPVFPPQRRCQGPRQGCAGLCSASGLPWTWRSSASQVRAHPCSGWTEGFLRLRSDHMPLLAPPSPGSHASAPTLSLGLLSLLPTHTLHPSRSWVLFRTQPRTPETPCRPCSHPGYLLTLRAPWSTDWHLSHSWPTKTRSPQLL